MPDNVFIKAEQIVRAAIGLLEREIVLPQMMWRDAAFNFEGAKNDTISIRLPAYASARTRTMRSNTGYTVDSLDETKIDLTLDTDVYKAIGVRDEELTLDIVNFGAQVLQPAMASVARGIEDAIASEMSGASYETEIDVPAAESYDPAHPVTTDPYYALVGARKALNDARVPMNDRFLAVGSSIEASLLNSPHLSRADQSGSDTAFRDAVIGRIAGFTATIVPGLEPDEGFAFHRTAFAFALRAPVVPAGVVFGASDSYAGLAMRVIRDYDFDNVRDRLLVNTYTGIGVTEDTGHFDANGQWVPAEDPDASGEGTAVVRAVKLTLGS